MLITLFFSCFLAATIVPFSSEAMVVWYFTQSSISPVVIVAVATVGNTLGGCTGYGLGYLGKTEWLQRWFRISPDRYTKFASKIQRYGFWMGLLCWVPVVGDPITVALGFFKTKSLPTILCMLIGKLLRYITVAAATLYFL